MVAAVSCPNASVSQELLQINLYRTGAYTSSLWDMTLAEAFPKH